MALSDDTPTSTRDRDIPPSTPRGQAFPAAPALQDWDSFVDELASELAAARAAATSTSPKEAFEAALVELTESESTPRELVATLSAPMRAATATPPPPPSGKTKVGPYGFATERKLRTLDPREPSIETTRLDLFTVPKTAPQRAEVPPSYRTRVGLYFVPQEPATEPSLALPDDDDAARPARRSILARLVAFFTRRTA